MTRIRFFGSSALADLSALAGSPLLEQHKPEHFPRKVDLKSSSKACLAGSCE
jgi:hypothetical protein